MIYASIESVIVAWVAQCINGRVTEAQRRNLWSVIEHDCANKWYVRWFVCVMRSSVNTRNAIWNVSQSDECVYYCFISRRAAHSLIIYLFGSLLMGCFRSFFISRVTGRSLIYTEADWNDSDKHCARPVTTNDGVLIAERVQHVQCVWNGRERDLRHIRICFRTCGKWWAAAAAAIIWIVRWQKPRSHHFTLAHAPIRSRETWHQSHYRNFTIKNSFQFPHSFNVRVSVMAMEQQQ